MEVEDVVRQAQDLVDQDAYEYAQEEGYNHWIPSTMVNPGEFSSDLDIDMKDLLYDEDSDTWSTEVKVWYHTHLILERDYTFYYVGAYLHRNYEDV